jgi:hypothetical protein
LTEIIKRSAIFWRSCGLAVRKKKNQIGAGFRYFLRDGLRSQGVSWGVCGSKVPPYDFLSLYGVFDSRFSMVPELLSLRPSLMAL